MPQFTETTVKFNPTPLRNAMVVKSITIEQLVVLTGFKRGTLATVLSGRCNKSKTIPLLCKVLGVRQKDCYKQVEDAISA